MRNAVTQVSIYSYPELIQSGNGKELINKILNEYQVEIEVKHLYGFLYHLKVNKQ